MKKILLINGSPRENGNTRLLSEAFITKSIQKGNIVKKYNIFDYDIKDCIDCDKCFTDEVPCVIEDDFNKLAEELVEADIIIFSLPVYFYSIPGHMKNFIDRLHAFSVGNKNISNKEYAIISCCAKDDMSMFDGLRIPLEKTAEKFGWTLLDEILAPNMKEAGAIDNTDGINRVRDLADRII